MLFYAAYGAGPSNVFDFNNDIQVDTQDFIAIHNRFGMTI